MEVSRTTTSANQNNRGWYSGINGNLNMATGDPLQVTKEREESRRLISGHKAGHSVNRSLVHHRVDTCSSDSLTGLEQLQYK